MNKPQFLKPAEDGIYKEDRSDVDQTSFTTFIYNPYIHQSMEKQRQKLPVFTVRNHILFAAEKYQTILILGETGSGKSTQIPQYLIESKWGEDGVVGVVQPRRVACTTLAARVADESSCVLGKEVGYTIRFDDNCTAGITKIKFMTEGILIREMMADPLLRQYCVIIIDEVHERNMYTDVILGLMKKILKKRRHLRLFVCSATYDVDHFFSFFNFNNTEEKEKDNVIVISIPGRNYPVNIYYSKDPIANYVKKSAETALEIHQNQPIGHILVFLTGIEEVDSCVQMIKDQIPSLKKSQQAIIVLPMHGSLPNNDQLQVFQPCAPHIRKVVVATNIAETSVTIPDIVYVIDCGFVKLRIYKSNSFSDSLTVVPTSKASAIQRAGRAGRTRSGQVYRLYPESEYTKLLEVTPPEMTRANLTSAVINLMALGIENLLRFDFPSPPPANNLITSLDELFALGALDGTGKLTPEIGIKMAEMPLPPQAAKMLLVSGDFECSEEMLSIISMLQVQNMFTFPPGKSLEARKMHEKFKTSEGDLITLLNIFTTFEEQKESHQWCQQHYLRTRALKRAKEIRNSMKKLVCKLGVEIKTSEGGVDAVCRCITAGMFPNAAYYSPNGSYMAVRGGNEMHIHPTSVLYYEAPPKWIVYHEVLHTSRVYMKDITVIERDWLLELAPHFYEKTTIHKR